MTQWILNLPILFRVVAILHFLQGLLMMFGGKFITEGYGWEYSIGFAAMAEHHGSGLICISLFFWFLPSLFNIQDLKRISSIALIVQAILILMPIYHAVFEYFPIDPSFFVIVIVLTIVMTLFYFSSRVNSEQEEN